MSITLEAAQAIIAKTFEHRKANGMKPLGVVVMDIRGVVKAAALEDGSSLARFDIASAKARGAMSFNMGTRALEKIAKDRPHFFTGAASAVNGGLVPVPGGVLIRDKAGAVLGAVGVSGHTSDNDEAAALAGITATGFVGDGG